jgi:hypothetical protein
MFKKRTRLNSKKACETQTRRVSKKTKSCPTLVATSHVITFHFHKESLHEEFLKSDNKGEEDG